MKYARSEVLTCRCRKGRCSQYLDEADELADEIVVIDHGLVIAAGTSEQLKDRVGGDVLEFTVPDRTRRSDAVTAISRRSARASRM